METVAARKRPTNLLLSADLVDAAKKMKINVSETCERALAAEVKRAREKEWLDENLPAIHAWNEWTEKNGFPLAQYRQL